jgi:DNA-binding NarL/FixJ family response regulator
LIDVLDKKFDVKSSLRYSKGKEEYKPMIYMNGDGYTNLHSIVDPFIQQFPCFLRKLGREKIVTAKVTEEQVKEIRQLFVDGLKYDEIAPMYNIRKSTIQNIVLKRSWKQVA